MPTGGLEGHEWCSRLRFKPANWGAPDNKNLDDRIQYVIT